MFNKEKQEKLFALYTRICTLEVALDSLEDYSYSTWSTIYKGSYDSILRSLEEAKEDYNELMNEG